VEEVTMNLSNMRMKIAPELHFGRFMDFANVFKSALFQGLKESKVSSSGKGGYQLMTIDAGISSVDVAMLEPTTLRTRSSSSLRGSPRFAAGGRSSSGDTPAFLERFVIRAGHFSLHIDRDTPPKITRSIINELDSDPNPRIYGLNQGGAIDL
jgi:hypothetical protein